MGKKVIMQLVYQWEIESSEYSKDEYTLTETAQKYRRWNPESIMGYDKAKFLKVTTVTDDNLGRVSITEEASPFTRKP